MVQFHVAGLRILETYFDEPATIRNLATRKLEDLATDIDAFIYCLSLLFDKAGSFADWVSTVPSVSKTHFLIVGRILQKWKDFYRLDPHNKGFQLVVPVANSADQDRPEVYGDPHQIEQLVYNLVGNAVKYCYEGAKIHIDCRLSTTDTTKHILTVSNYGPDMPPGERYYELFGRGVAQDDANEGLGIGLFLARQIALAHGGRIWHTSDHVCALNVPALAAYRRYLSADDPDVDRRHHYAKEWETIAGILQTNEVVAFAEDGNLRHIPETIEDAVDAIGKPTYRVTLHVELPRKDEE